MCSIILPSFLPRDLPASAYFWHQARSVKQQTTRATKSPLLAARTLLMALERERRSIGFERADDERREREATEAMVGLGISGVAVEQEKEAGANDAAQPKEEEAHVKPAQDAQTQQQKQELLDRSARPKAPSTALMGLSMLGSASFRTSDEDIQQLRSPRPRVQTWTPSTGMSSTTASSCARAFSSRAAR